MQKADKIWKDLSAFCLSSQNETKPIDKLGIIEYHLIIRNTYD